jgi:hypothetical protein
MPGRAQVPWFYYQQKNNGATDIALTHKIASITGPQTWAVTAGYF